MGKIKTIFIFLFTGLYFFSSTVISAFASATYSYDVGSKKIKNFDFSLFRKVLIGLFQKEGWIQ